MSSLTVESSSTHDACLAQSSAEAQAVRREQVLALHRTSCSIWFGHDGHFKEQVKADPRWYLWCALSFLSGESDHVCLANAMLRVGAGLGGGHFWTSAAASILSRFSDRLEPTTLDMMRQRMRELLPAEVGQRFRGYNDNFPSMSAVAVLVGGPAIGDDRAVSDGLKCLDSLRRLLTRRGLLSEYTSPTYTPITLTCLAEVAQLAPNAEARELALWCEQRVWMDLCSHFHPGTCALAGPHSRAYMVDLCAHLHNAHMVLYQAFGDVVFINPTNALMPYQNGQATHNSPYHIRGHLPWHLVPTYHVPEDAARLVHNRQHPMSVHATAEQAAMQRNVWKHERHPQTPLAEVPASSLNLHTYMTDDFAMGTSDRPFLDGYQMSVFHLAYRRQRPARTLADVAALFPRYLTTQIEPDRHHHLNDQGRANAVAHEGAAMVAYKARCGWGSQPQPGDPTVEPTDSLRLSLLLTCFNTSPDEIWLGDERLNGWEGQTVQPTSIFWRDGPVLVALHPLSLRDHGRQFAIALRESNGFAMIDLFNYQGSPRTFTADELLTTHNGFVIEVASTDQWESLAAFRAHHARHQIIDHYHPGDCMRTLRYEREGLSLGMELSPVSDGIKCRTVNDQLATEQRFHVAC
jgi:hypothetical protein